MSERVTIRRLAMHRDLLDEPPIEIARVHRGRYKKYSIPERTPIRLPKWVLDVLRRARFARVVLDAEGKIAPGKFRKVYSVRKAR